MTKPRINPITLVIFQQLHQKPQKPQQQWLTSFFSSLYCCCCCCCCHLKRISLNWLLSNIISAHYIMYEREWMIRLKLATSCQCDRCRCHRRGRFQRRLRMRKYISLSPHSNTSFFFFSRSITFGKEKSLPHIVWLLLIDWVEWNEQVHNIIMPMFNVFQL